jgi:hypothetical protein
LLAHGCPGNTRRPFTPGHSFQSPTV